MLHSHRHADRLTAEAWLLCDELRHRLYCMDLPADHPNAYNDWWRDRIEAMLARAERRYERRRLFATPPR